MNTEQLVFMKQLLENHEYANENGLLNILKLFKSDNHDLTEGTSYALGAFDTFNRLMELRPDLCTEKIKKELIKLSKDKNQRYSSVAESIINKYFNLNKL